MLNTDKKEILTSLGYRPVGNDTYVKPFGFNLFSYDLTENIISNYINCVDGEVRLFESKLFLGENNFTVFVKMFEKSAHLSVENESNFGFMTMAERIECLL